MTKRSRGSSSCWRGKAGPRPAPCAAALILQGQTAAGIAQLTQGLAATLAIGDVVLLPYYCSLLASAYGHAGQPHEGLRGLAEAHALVEQTGERWCQAEVYRLQGELLLQQERPEQHWPAAVEAEACLQQALATARRQQAKALELLAPIYGCFTEGFDTADLQEARAFVQELT